MSGLSLLWQVLEPKPVPDTTHLSAQPNAAYVHTRQTPLAVHVVVGLGHEYFEISGRGLVTTTSATAACDTGGRQATHRTLPLRLNVVMYTLIFLACIAPIFTSSFIAAATTHHDEISPSAWRSNTP